MAYVWIHTNSKSVFMDDKYLPPCNTCGLAVKACRDTNGCEEKAVQANSDVFCILCSDEGCGTCLATEDNGCSWCGASTTSACRCDNDYEQASGK